MNTIQRTAGGAPFNSLNNEKQDLTLTKGQVILGVVKEIDENKMAKVQIGDIEWKVKVEADIRQNGTYAFVVSNTTDVSIELKLYVPNLLSNKRLEAIVKDLLKEWGLQESKQAEKVIRHFLSVGSPVNKDNVYNILNIVGDEPLTEESLDILRQMNGRALPTEKVIFQALSEANVKKTMGEQISQFIKHIEHIEGESVKPLKHWFEDNFSNQQIIQKVPLTKMTDSVIHKIQSACEGLNKEEALILLQGKPSEIQELIGKLALRTTPQALNGLVQTLNELKRVSAEWGGSISLKDTPGPLKGQPQGNEMIEREIMKQSELSFLSSPNNERLRNEKSTQVLNTPKHENHLNVDILPKYIRGLIEKIGYNFEKEVAVSRLVSSTLEEQLKPLLIQVTEDEKIPREIRKEAQSLLMRISGMQILSQQSDSLLQTYHVTIPLLALGIETDLQLKWQGKRREDGSLDPNFCRILFDVNLEAMGRTILDVQIVNRVVSMQINTEQKMDADISPYIEDLKRSLIDKNYLLGSVSTRITSYNKNEQEEALVKSKSLTKNSTSYKGLDVRI